MLAASLVFVPACTGFTPLKWIAGAKNILCAPTAQEKADAALAIDFLQMAIGYVSGERQVQFIEAKNVFFSFILPGICVGIDQLEAAIKTFDEAAKAIPLKGTAPNIDSLRALTEVK